MSGPRWFPDAMPVPAASAVTLPWWRAASDHRLVVQVCDSCGVTRHPPSPRCPRCHSSGATWREVPGTGTVYTFTVVHQAFLPALTDHVPYVVAVVELDEGDGARLVTNIVDTQPSAVHIGDRVQIVFEDMGPELALPRAHLAVDAGASRERAQAVSVAEIRVGVLYDFDQGDDGRYFEAGLALGFDESAVESRVGAPVTLIARHADGLPGGSAQSVIDNFDQLVAAGVIAIVGPSISDNGLIVRDLAATATVPCINYTGGAITRGEWMFHYQVGSLEEEPAILVDHLQQRGVQRIAVLYDDTPVGSNYSLWFDRALARTGRPAIDHRAAVSALSEDLRHEIEVALTTQPDALVYLGLGVASRAVAVAVDALDWKGQVVANSALMFGYRRRDWRAGFEGWVYVDTVSDANPVRARLASRSKAHGAGPIGVAAFDIGRLLGEAIALADEPSNAGVRDGLERVKRLPAASGKAGTTMGFGQWDHAALKGDALVLRTWRDGRTEELG